MMEIIKKSSRSKARRGVVKTTHGNVQSPFFMTIATKGAVKSMAIEDLERSKVPIVLANTYHLLCKPGMKAMRERGGLHKWMKWDGPMLTDSGGYQVFSLGKMRKVTEEGVVFRSHIDGSKISLTPEESVAMQQAIGSDIMMQLDVVLPPDSKPRKVREAMARSIRWAKRCKEYLDANRKESITQDQKLFGIVQGGIDEELRAESIDGLVELDLDGYAIGGLSVGESREDNLRVAEFVADKLPVEKPRYFMGGGMPEEIVAYVKMGIDMFDCVIPTRHARHGSLFVWNSEPGAEMLEGEFYNKMNIGNAEYRADDGPVDPHCDCDLCIKYSRSYLHHLMATNEILGTRLATEHNIRFYMKLMEVIREGIEGDKF